MICIKIPNKKFLFFGFVCRSLHHKIRKICWRHITSTLFWFSFNGSATNCFDLSSPWLIFMTHQENKWAENAKPYLSQDNNVPFFHDLSYVFKLVLKVWANIYFVSISRLKVPIFFLNSFSLWSNFENRKK